MSAEEAPRLHCQVRSGTVREEFSVGVDQCYLGRSKLHLDKKAEHDATRLHASTCVRVLDYESVSSVHCKIWYEPSVKQFFVQDLKSRNGTFLADPAPSEAQKIYKCIGDREQKCERQSLYPLCSVRLAKAVILVTNITGIVTSDEDLDDAFIDGGTVTEGVDVTDLDLVLQVVEGPGVGQQHVVRFSSDKSCTIGRLSHNATENTRFPGDSAPVGMHAPRLPASPGEGPNFLIDDAQRKISRKHLLLAFLAQGERFSWTATAKTEASWICPRELVPALLQGKRVWQKLRIDSPRDIAIGDMLRCGYSQICVKKHAGPPGAMSKVERQASNESNIVLRWSQPQSPTSIKAYILSMRPHSKHGDEMAWEDVFGGSRLTNTVEGLQADTAHCFRVRARNAGGLSEWSPPACFFTRGVDGGVREVLGDPDEETTNEIDVGGVHVWSGDDDDTMGLGSAGTTPKTTELPDLTRKIRWQKGKLLGRGASGEVSAGLDLDTNTLMAVKEVYIFEQSQEEIDRKAAVVENEIAVLRDLDHINIVKYLGTDRTTHDDHTTVYLFLEYVPDGSLSRLMQTMGGVCTEDLTGSYTRQILDGVAYLHSQRVVHRDLKTDNILVMFHDGHHICKIADFGSSARLVGERENFRTFTGTPQFMAPEVVKQKGSSFKCDVWSVGCIVLDLLTGSPPFAKLAPPQAIYRIGTLKEPPPPPENMSADGRNFLVQALALSAEQRPSALQLLKHPWLAGHRPVPASRRAHKRTPSASWMSNTTETARSDLQQIDRQQLQNLSEIGRGGFGRVVKACYMDTDVAIKYIDLKESKEAQMSEILKEASVLSSLRHPNVLLFMGVVNDGDGEIGIVTEFLDGGDLAGLLYGVPDSAATLPCDSDGPTDRNTGKIDVAGTSVLLALPTRMVVLCDVAKGLSFLHSRGVIHGDINPRNILLTKELSHAKLADFGLSHRGNEVSKGATVRYAAPETLRLQKAARAADVFSLSLVVYEVIALTRPYAHLSDPSQRKEWSEAEHDANPPGDISNVRVASTVPKVASALCALALVVEQSWDGRPGGRPNSRDILQGVQEVINSTS